MTFNDLSQWLVDDVKAYPAKNNQIAIWREPILACAAADGRFQRLKEITVPDHALPQDLLPGAKTVLAWFMPFKQHLPMENIGGERPALIWGSGLSRHQRHDRPGRPCDEDVDRK